MYMASSSSSLLPENDELITTKQKALIEELVQGRGLATQLRAILWKTDVNEDNNGGDTAEDLVSKIMRSFKSALFMLEKNDNNNTYTNTNTSTTTISTNCNENDYSFLVGSSQCLELDHNGPKSEDSEESSKSVSMVVVTQKDRRGCYKRRKTLNSWKRDTPTLIDDGFAWRKYGQKAILKSKHPRNYFRCTHKYDQKCMATKHVQKIQEEPPMYRTTYYSNHTCRNLLTAPELVLDCSSSPTHENSNNNSTLLSFNPASKHSHHPFFSTLKHVKQEFKDEVVATIVPYCNNNEEDNNNNNVIAINDMTNNDNQNISGFDHHHDDQISSNLWDMEAFEDLKHLSF